MGGKFFANNLLNRSNENMFAILYKTDKYKYHSKKEWYFLVLFLECNNFICKI